MWIGESLVGMSRAPCLPLTSMGLVGGEARAYSAHLKVGTPLRYLELMTRQLPIRYLVIPVHNPVACNTQMQTKTTTTTFRIVLMLEAMGIYLLIMYNAIPTMTNTMTRFTKGMFLYSSRPNQKHLVDQ
jgi:hypothetical protein